MCLAKLPIRTVPHPRDALAFVARVGKNKGPVPHPSTALSWMGGTEPTSLPLFPARPFFSSERGLTFVELIVTVAILSILATAAVPIARFQIKRQNERQLRFDLWEMRDAIDKYKDAADKGAFQTKVDSQNYPPDLETLVTGVDVQGKKLKFLRKIPIDPMTNKPEWGLRSMQDDPDSDSYGGQSVFDVYSKSQGTGLDGTRYSTW
jgi:general secretion pathway protein G